MKKGLKWDFKEVDSLSPKGLLRKFRCTKLFKNVFNKKNDRFNQNFPNLTLKFITFRCFLYGCKLKFKKDIERDKISIQNLIGIN